MRYAVCLAGLPILLLASSAHAEPWYQAERNAYFSSVPANAPLRSRPPTPTATSSAYRPAYYAPPSGSAYGPALYQNQCVPNYLSHSYYTPANYPVAPATPRFFSLPR